MNPAPVSKGSRLAATAVAVLVASAVAWPARAHVFIESPVDGDVIEAGSDLLVEWTVSVQHGPPDTYDLMFSSDGGEHFVVLVEGVGSDTTSYLWSVPSRAVPEAELVIVQHGADGYTFMHEVLFTVELVGSGDAGSDAGSDVGLDLGVADARSLPDARVAVDASGEQPPATAEELLALLERRCAVPGCHAGPSPQAGLNLAVASSVDNLDNLINAPTSVETGQVRVVPCEPEASHLLARVRGDGVGRMPPPPEAPLSTGTIQQIERWIADGAPAAGPIDGQGECSVAGRGSESGCASAGSGSSGLTPVWGALLLLALGACRRGRRRWVGSRPHDGDA